MPDKLTPRIKEYYKEALAKRELYRQQQAARIGRPLPEKPAAAAATLPPAGVEAAEGRAAEISPAARLKGEQAMARAAAGAEAAIERMKKGDIGGAIKVGAAAAAEVGGQLATAQILKFMWLKIYFVLPLLYINFHFIMRYLVGSKAFCRFGEEWLGGGKGPGKAGVPGGPSSTVTGGGAVGSQAIQVGGSLTELVEIIALLLCDFIVATLIFILLAFIYFITHPCDLAAILPGWAWVRDVMDFFKICSS